MEPFTPTPNTSNTQNMPTPLTPQVPQAPVNTSAQPEKSTKPSLFKQWYFWAMVGVSIFGVLGICFGAYELDAAITAQDRITELEAEMTEKNQLLVRYGVELGYRLDDFGRPIETPDDGPVDTAKYLPIEEWEVKLKIPENLYNISYNYHLVTVDFGEAGERITEHFCTTGTLYETNDLPEYATLYNNVGLGCLARYKKELADKDTFYNASDAFYEDDEYYYSYTAPQSVISSDASLIEQEVATTQVIREMLVDGFTKQ